MSGRFRRGAERYNRLTAFNADTLAAATDPISGHRLLANPLSGGGPMLIEVDGHTYHTTWWAIPSKAEVDAEVRRINRWRTDTETAADRKAAEEKDLCYEYGGGVPDSGAPGAVSVTSGHQLERIPPGLHTFNDKIERPGLYLGMYHGREAIDEDLDDWGFDGPVIGPLNYIVYTYGNGRMEVPADIAKILTNETNLTLFCGPNEFIMPCDGGEGLLEVNGRYYGDWEIFTVPQQEKAND